MRDCRICKKERYIIKEQMNEHFNYTDYYYQEYKDKSAYHIFFPYQGSSNSKKQVED